MLQLDFFLNPLLLGHEPHQLFSELVELQLDEWKETARWVRFEEDVEEGANRWSKPHVSSLSLHSLMELRNYLKTGSTFLELDAENLEDIVDFVLENLISNNKVTYDLRDKLKTIILQKHRHQFEGMKKIRSDASMKKSSSFETGFILNAVKSFSDMSKVHSAELGLSLNKSADNLEEDATNSHFLKKIPKGAEAANIMVGEVDFLTSPISVFIRLGKAVRLGDLTEVALPTRFIFILLGPPREAFSLDSYKEVGRSIGTSFSDEVFHEVAYRARTKEHLVMGLDEFLDSVTVLPPGEWDRNTRIEPPTLVPSQHARKVSRAQLTDSNGGALIKNVEEVVDEEEEKYLLRKEAGLVASGKFCGGLVNDIKRKANWYISDFKDALSPQSIAVVFFLYFATLAPTIAFGGILGQNTKNRMASIESLVSGLTAGVIYAMFAGQPLTILGLTGPDLVFETLVFDFCEGHEWDYLSFRLWIGVWIAIILIILVVTDASSFVCYITRFTEECFACLIAVIFIKKSLENVANIASTHPYTVSPCYCKPLDLPANWEISFGEIFHRLNETEIEETLSIYNVTSRGEKCWIDMADSDISFGFTSPGCNYAPNAFFLSVILFFGTYIIATFLKDFKDLNFFPAVVRSYISDFAVITAILLMVFVDVGFGIDTPKLNVPSTFNPTWSGRSWLISPFGRNPWWSALAAAIPALLGSILIFMDQQITAVIVNRKENKMVKGGGYHLDLLVLACTIVINSVLGIPWYVASTILSITHVKSLQRESETSAPGEKRIFLGIREQRVTAIFVFILVGCSAFMTPILGYIPMPVLYGVFLYMGINSLNGIQMFDRILLMFMPKKYQPEYSFLKKIPLKRVNLFSFIQVLCFIVLWLIQEFKAVSILFPIMLVIIIGIRKLLDYVFSQYEMKVIYLLIHLSV